MGERGRREALARRRELVERPPAVAVDVLRDEVDRRHDGERVAAHEVEALALPEEPPIPGERVLPHPDDRPRIAQLEPRLLEELTAERLLVALARVSPAAGRAPPDGVRDGVLE